MNRTHRILIPFLLAAITADMPSTFSASEETYTEAKQATLRETWKLKEAQFNHMLEKYDWTHAEVNQLLSEAIENDYASATKKLVQEMGADVNAQNKFGLTPLYWAIQVLSCPAILHFLFKQGAQLDRHNYRTTSAWIRVVMDTLKGNVDGVTALFQRTAHRIRAKQEKLYLVHLAAYAGHKDLVICLIAFGFSATELNLQNQNPLHLAAYAGHSDIVVYLIRSGAEINLKDAQGNTPLHYAAMQNHCDIISSLVDAGANLIAENKQRITPLDYILDFRHDVRAALRRKLPENCVETICSNVPLDYVPRMFDQPRTQPDHICASAERPTKRQRRA